jgi:hypothetical protein
VAGVLGRDGWTETGRSRSIWGTVLCLIGYEVTIIMNRFIVSERDCLDRSRMYADKLDTDSFVESGAEVLDGWTIHDIQACMPC